MPKKCWSKWIFSVFVIYCTEQFNLLKQHTYSLTVSVDQESGHGLAGSSGPRSLPGLQSRHGPGLQSSQGSTGKDPLPSLLMSLLAGFSSLRIVGPHFFLSCWLEAFFDSRPYGPLHRASHNMQLPSSEWARERTRKSASKRVLTRESHSPL